MKRQRLDRAINARVINFPDANNHLTGLLTEYLSRSLGLPGDPPGTNTVIGLLKSGLGDLIVLAGLKEWLQEQVDAGILEAANQAQFNQWVKDHIGQTEQDIDTIDSTLDTINRWVDRASKVISIIAKAVKAIKDILSIFGFIEIPQGTTPQYDYNSNFDPDDPDELEEFVNALIEILSNGWLKPKFYTKAEITALLNDYLTKSEASTNYYTKIQVDTYLTTLATQKANSSDVYTKSETNTLLAAKADVSNTYTKTETDTLLNNKVNSSTLSSYSTTSSIKAFNDMTNYYNKTYMQLNYYTTQQLNDTFMITIMNLIYPVKSIFLYYDKITLVDGMPTSSTGTPLDYGKWQLLNDSLKDQVLGLRKRYNNTEGGISGSETISLSDLPDHAHKGLTGFYGWNNDQGSWKMPFGESGWGGDLGDVEYVSTKNAIGTSSGRDFTPRGTQTNFVPYGLYVFAYYKYEINS